MKPPLGHLLDSSTFEGQPVIRGGRIMKFLFQKEAGGGGGERSGKFYFIGGGGDLRVLIVKE